MKRSPGGLSGAGGTLNAAPLLLLALPPDPRRPQGPQRSTCEFSPWLIALIAGDTFLVILVRRPVGPHESCTPACLRSIFYKGICGRRCFR